MATSPEVRGGSSIRRRLLDIEITPKKIKAVDLMNFCRHLSVFITAGVPILNALGLIRDDARDRELCLALDRLIVGLRDGQSLSGSLRPSAKALPGYFVSMLEAAEETGQLAAILDQLAGYLERDIESRQNIRSALMYPAIVLALSTVSVGILVGYALPKFVKFFHQYGAHLPLTTRILLDISAWIEHFGLVVLMILILLAATVGLTATLRRGRLIIDRSLLRLPIISRLIQAAIIERFARALSSMIRAGVPLTKALEVAATGSGNHAFTLSLQQARTELVAGDGLVGPLERTGAFPPAAIQMLRVGEETGTLEERMDDIAGFYGKELQIRLKRTTDLLEPVAVMIVGIVVGFVAIAVISAIYGVFGSAKLK